MLPVFDQDCLVKKVDQKGGWHYVVIGDIAKSLRGKGGLLRVSGLIDTYQLQQFNLLPMKDGRLFLPLNTIVRKHTRKKEGDTVRVVLYLDDSPVEIPDDILVCLLESEQAHTFFMSLSDSNKKYYIDWIEQAKRLETKVDRIARMLEMLENGVKFYDWVKREG